MDCNQSVLKVELKMLAVAANSGSTSLIDLRFSWVDGTEPVGFVLVCPTEDVGLLAGLAAFFGDVNIRFTMLFFFSLTAGEPFEVDSSDLEVRVTLSKVEESRKFDDVAKDLSETEDASDDVSKAIDPLGPPRLPASLSDADMPRSILKSLVSPLLASYNETLETRSIKSSGDSGSAAAANNVTSLITPFGNSSICSCCCGTAG